MSYLALGRAASQGATPVFATLGGTTPTSSPTATTTPYSSGFTVVDSPNIGGGINELLGVSARAANDAWAVGYYTSGGIPRTLALHWNGRAWDISSTPNQGVRQNTLQAVAARAAGDAWAVGYYEDSRGVLKTLALHWNGRRWVIIPTPNKGRGDNALYGITQLPTSAAWAVGYYADKNNVMQTLIQRWNGRAWRIVASPNNPGALNRLFAISANAIDSAWATGVSVDGSGRSTPLIERWNGTKWSIQPFDALDTEQQQLNSVSAVDAGNTIAVGYYFPTITNTESLALRWSGGDWTDTGGPNPIGTGNVLQGVSSVSANNAWAAGTQYNAGFLPQTLLMQYDGGVWSHITSPNSGSGANYLNGVSALPGDVWAVGSYNNEASVGRTLILRLRRSSLKKRG